MNATMMMMMLLPLAKLEHKVALLPLHPPPQPPLTMFQEPQLAPKKNRNLSIAGFVVATSMLLCLDHMTLAPGTFAAGASTDTVAALKSVGTNFAPSRYHDFGFVIVAVAGYVASGFAAAFVVVVAAVVAVEVVALVGVSDKKQF